MKPLLWKFIVMLLLTVHANTGYAQIERIEKGDKVRIEAPTISITPITGDVNEISNQGILLYGSSDEILFNAMDRLEVGKFKRRTWRGALIGGATGGLVIGLINLGQNDPCPINETCFFDWTDSEAFLIGAVVGGVPGLLIGGIIGSTIEGVNWKTIRINVSDRPLAIRFMKPAKAPGLTVKWSF